MVEIIKDIKIIVKEHLDQNEFEKTLALAYGVSEPGSSVAVKLVFDGEPYGKFAYIYNPELSAKEVAEISSQLLNSIFEELGKVVKAEEE